MPKNYEQLKKEALKANKEVFDKATGKMVKTNFTEAQALEATVQYFLKGGLDYKGQFQSCFETKGGGVQVDFNVDPGKLFSYGCLSTELDVSVSGTRAREVILVAQRGPSKLDYNGVTLTIPQPIMINCLSGVHWEGAAKVGIDVSVGIKYEIGTDKKKLEHSFEEPKFQGVGDLKLELEYQGVGFTAEAKAGIAAEAGYTYENFYAVDLCPIPFEDELRVTEVSEMLAALFTAESYKDLMKKRACAFANKYNTDSEKINYQGRFGGHIGSADICTNLDKLIAARSISQRFSQDTVATRAQSIIDSLQCWADKNAQPKVSTSAFISSHQAKGKAGLYANAELKVNAAIASAGASGRAEGPTIGGEYKTSTVRYQTVYSAPSISIKANKPYDKSYVIMTQDTHLIYSKIEFSLLHLKAEMSASLVTGTSIGVKTEEHEKLDEKLTFGKVEFLNRITYTTATVLWHKHYPSSAIETLRQRLSGKQKQSFEINTYSLQGTGVSLGGSFIIENLLKFYEAYDSNKKTIANKRKMKSYITLAKSIGLSLDDLIKFLTDPFTKILLEDLKEANKIKVVLIEASFPVDRTEITMIHTFNGDKEFTELAPGTAKKITEKYDGSPYKSPEVVRLRYRLQDISNRDSDLFKLGGFKVDAGGVSFGGGITLKKVNRAGSEAIIDLHAVWFDDEANSRNDQTINYENGVPQVALFCQ